MEHRCSQRLPLVLPALIHRHEHPIVIGKTRNVCLEGMFIETDPAELDRNMCLEVVLVHKTNAGARRLYVPTVVAHCAADGAGLMFRSLSPDAEQTLLNLLRQRRQTLAPATPLASSY